MKEALFNLIRKRRLNISIYTEEIFERRCQEEIIRSDEEQSSFAYLEFDFTSIRAAYPDDETNLQFWDSVISTIAKSNRGSDIIGFLENGAGLGLLLLDSKEEGWKRVKGRILQTAKENSVEGVQHILNDLIRPIIYPACIQDPSTELP